jgi:hypothetical protein
VTEGLAVSVAVSDCTPAVLKATTKLCATLSSAVKV